MEVDKENIKKVLALFDEEDIQYIDLDNLNNLLDNDDSKKDNNSNVKVKKLGDKNDRRRK